MKEASKWTKQAFPNGPDPVKHSEETKFNIAYIIGEVESDHQEHMPASQYVIVALVACASTRRV